MLVGAGWAHQKLRPGQTIALSGTRPRTNKDQAHMEPSLPSPFWRLRVSESTIASLPGAALPAKVEEPYRLSYSYPWLPVL